MEASNRRLENEAKQLGEVVRQSPQQPAFHENTTIA